MSKHGFLYDWFLAVGIGGVVGTVVAVTLVVVLHPGSLVAELLGGAGALLGMVVNMAVWSRLALR